MIGKGPGRDHCMRSWLAITVSSWWR